MGSRDIYYSPIHVRVEGDRSTGSVGTAVGGREEVPVRPRVFSILARPYRPRMAPPASMVPIQGGQVSWHVSLQVWRHVFSQV